MTPVWIGKAVALAVHAEQLRRHGGQGGVRDMSLLESAMARPQNVAAYGDPDVAELAASYAFGIARNHPFVDGNKRTSCVAALLFLRLNGVELACTDQELGDVFVAVAAGAMTEQRLAEWLHSSIRG